MKVFVWERIDNATNKYHPEGGLVIFAETEVRARELANMKEGCELSPAEFPNDVREVVGGEEKVYIMQDAGCC